MLLKKCGEKREATEDEVVSSDGEKKMCVWCQLDKCGAGFIVVVEEQEATR